MATVLKSTRREFAEELFMIISGSATLRTPEGLEIVGSGYDVCEYPDSNKIFLAPSYEIFDKDAQLNYFDGEENIRDKWKQIESKDDREKRQ